MTDSFAEATNHVEPPPERTIDAALEQVRDSLRGLRYGVVSIIVQDGVVVQIERTEKRRLRKPDPK